jgi:hypothetical protein
MKYIKQKSTGKIIFREEPHSDKTIDNAVVFSGIDKSDLEVAENSWSEDDWIDNSVSYQDKRQTEYPTIGDQLDKIYHDGIDAWKADMIKPIKDKYPKE